MNCIIHPELAKVGLCTKCGRVVCERCVGSLPDKPIVCNVCASQVSPGSSSPFMIFATALGAMFLIGMVLISALFLFWRGGPLDKTRGMALATVVVAIALVTLLVGSVWAFIRLKRRGQKIVRTFQDTQKWADELGGVDTDEKKTTWPRYASILLRPEILIPLLIALFLFVLPIALPAYRDRLKEMGDTLLKYKELILFPAMLLFFLWEGSWIIVTRSFIGQGNYDRALQVIQVGLRLQPHSGDLHTAMMEAYLRQGRMAEAEQAARRRVRLLPNDPSSYNNLGGLLADMGYFVQAQVACQHGIELNAGSPTAYNNLAWALIVRGEQLERAVDLLQIGLRLCHSDEQRSMCNSTLSLAFLKQGVIEPALARAQMALQQAGREHRPRLAELHYGLGLIQQAAGRIREAQSSFEQVSKLDPRGRYVDKARRSLMEMGCLGLAEANK